MRHLAVLLIGLLLALPLHADVFKPAYLQLQQVDSDTFDVLWKVPALDANTILKVKPAFPAGTREIITPRSIYTDGAVVQRWQVQVPGGLEGKPILFGNLQNTGLDVLVRVERIDGSQQLDRVLPVSPSFVMKASPGSWEVVTTYTVLGIEHILMGFDHLLFVLALLLIVRGTRRLLVTITAFTVAHSITLALAALDIVHVPGPPVEAIIALSIVFVAAELLHLRQGREGLAVRKPWVIAFVFGLLHGLGFASALAEVGLPHNAIPLALLFFNVGVEIGQLLFIAAASSIIALARRLRLPWPRWAELIPPYAIGGAAMFWVIQRISAF